MTNINSRSEKLIHNKKNDIKLQLTRLSAVDLNLGFANPQGFTGRFLGVLGWSLSFHVLLLFNILSGFFKGILGIQVPRISKNYYQDHRIREIGSPQDHTWYLTFSLKKHWSYRGKCMPIENSTQILPMGRFCQLTGSSGWLFYDSGVLTRKKVEKPWPSGTTTIKCSSSLFFILQLTP